MGTGAPDQDLDVSLLEPVLQRLVARVGMPATMRIVERCAGVPTYFPKDLEEGHWLAELVGVDAARKACDELGAGEHHTLPRGLAALRAVRNRAMRQVRSSSSINQLARHYGLTRRRVQQVFSEDCGQDPDQQSGLFD